MSTNTVHTVEHYLSLPYHIEVIYDSSSDNPGWFAQVLEWPGCMTQGDTFEELGVMLREAMELWVSTRLEDGLPIPEPRVEEDYSGKFVVRVAKSLHRELVETAEREGVSLNAYVSTCLAEAVGAGASAPAAASAPTPATAPSPAPQWSGSLSARAQAALVAAGLQVELGQLNESLFAHWLENNLQQTVASLEGGYYREAADYLKKCQQATQLCAPASPLMAVMDRLLALTTEQVANIHTLREGFVEQSLIRRRIQAEVREPNNNYAFERVERGPDVAQQTAALFDEVGASTGRTRTAF